MNNFQFIQSLYKGKNCYSDSMSDEQIELLHISSGVESIISRMIQENRIVFLTGNPGDGKTYIIRALSDILENVYTVTDLNSVTDAGLDEVIEKINDCYCKNKPCVIAANEFPFYKLTNRVKELFPRVHEELMQVKRNIIIYGHPSVVLGRICVIDLNERNLLDKDHNVIKQILDRFTVLLEDFVGSNPVLSHNISALKCELVQSQLLTLFSLISMTGQHFVIRDILGTISYILVSCTDVEKEGSGFYYDALFEGDNDFMQFAKQFDPVLLSSPSFDERLWNGELTEGWQVGIPDRWPFQISNGNGSAEEATILFKSIKRKFFFENCYSKNIASLQSQDIQECIELLVKLKQDSSKYKRMLTYSMNKLFLSSDEEYEKLRIWTSHSYDLSRFSSAAVSTRYISIDELDLAYPEPIPWLREMEYSPSYIVMLAKKNKDIKLEIDIDLLRSLMLIKNGYPTSLLSTRYEQMVSQFVKSLYAGGFSRDYGDGEILIADRRSGDCKRIRIEHNKYYLGKEVSF